MPRNGGVSTMPMKTRAWLRLLLLPWLNVTKCTFYSTWILPCSGKQDGGYADSCFFLLIVLVIHQQLIFFTILCLFNIII